MEEEDMRREAAIASSPSLQPNFNSPGVTKDQLSKFQELHKKRMQIKKKSEQKRWKDETRKFQEKPNSKNRIDEDTSVEESSLSNSSLISKEDSSVEQQDMQQQITFMKRRKLHWGLDVKERWERKSNM
ncbi:protein FAM204A [Rhodamnia argentea]|uniref:Protein FAM204A n=1 Tax=Rhodamnia argentea TaxID=178133 RepID=A0A8B8PPY4_9MYRT|nr:protein FAM204A [Rhodamnia argentea]